MLSEEELKAQKVLDPWSFESQNIENSKSISNEILRIMLWNERVRGLGSKLARISVKF